MRGTFVATHRLRIGSALRVLAAGLAVLFGGAPSGFPESLDLQLSGQVELRGTYDSNLFLTAEDYDFELRRLDGDQTERDDLYGTLGVDLELKVPLSAWYDQKIRYRLDGDRYNDYSRENTDRHRFQFQPVFHLSDSVDLLLEYGFDADNQRGSAEYYRPDYFEHRGGAAMNWRVSSKDTVELSWFYEDRDYSSLDDTPFDDYEGHETELKWNHRLSRQWSTTASALYRTLSYDEDTLDRFGDTIVDKDRDDDRAELGLAVTWLPVPKVLLRSGYVYRNHWATGDFYDYQMHRVYGIWVQNFPWQLRWQTYLHYEWRDFDDQQAQDTLYIPANDTWVQGLPDGDRGDEQLFLLLNLTKAINKSFSCGAEFQYLNNSSDDDSSEYETERYSLFVRYRF